MALEQRLSPRLQQKLVMTPALQLAIKLLQLNKLELEQTLQQELMENPVLEEREEQVEEDDLDHGAAEETDQEDRLIDNLDVDSYFASYFDYQPTSPNMREEAQAPRFENALTTSPTLTDHLIWQLEMSDLSETAVEIGQAVIGNLDPDGYLQATAAEIATMGAWPLKRVEHCIARLRQFDPAGVGAVDLRHCLLLQLDRLGLQDSLATLIVEQHFEQLSRRNYKAIAVACKVGLEAVAEAIEVVRRLNPKPGQIFGSDSPRYIVPDVHVLRDRDRYVVNIDDDGLPKLRVSRLYRDMLRSRNGLSSEARSFLREKVRAALWLIKSFGQRHRTIRKVAESIVDRQQEFFDQGVAFLKPMVLRDVAEDIDMHESTVSRVVNGKYMHTPQGIFEMKFFFHSGLGHVDGSEVSSLTVKERMRKLIDSEDCRKPFSDAAIARRLKQSGLRIARRTVAKYREETGIPASKARKAIL